MEELTQLISNVGFPIVTFLLMFWYVNKKDSQHQEETNALRDAILKLNETVLNNTAVILELKDVMRNV